MRELDEDKIYNLDEDNEEKEPSAIPAIVAGMCLGVAALPALILGFAHYLIWFRIKKLKPKVSFLACLLEFLLLVIVFNVILLFRERTILFTYISICCCLGVFLGQCLIFYRAHLLKAYPEMTALRGWAYKFEYKESIFDRIKRNKIIKECTQGELCSEEAAPLGVLDAPVIMDNGEEYKNIEPVYSYYEEAVRTRFVTGLTGSGKTITMLTLVSNDIRAGYPICFLDFKKGLDIAYFLSKLAKEYNRPFYHFKSGPAGSYRNPFCKEQASYDPLSSGTATSKADMVLNMRAWDSASDVYKGRTQSILQAIFYLLETVDRKALPRIPWKQGGLSQLVAALKVENLYDMIDWLEKDMRGRETSQGERNRLTELQALYRELTASTKSALREQVEGLATICRTLIMSSYSDWLAAGETPYHINLSELALSDEKPIILFQFNPNEEQEFARYLGNIIMSDLSRASAEKEKRGNKSLFGLYIDECQVLDPNKIATLVEKVRSARFFTTISAQSSTQISKAATQNSEDTLLALYDTINTFIVHKGATEKTALMLSQIVSKVDKTTYKVTGKRSSNILSLNRKNARDSIVSTVTEKVYKVEPDEFQTLSAPSKNNNFKAQAYYITKLTSDPEFADETKPVARKVWIIPNEEVLESIPESFKKQFNNDKRVTRKKITPVQAPVEDILQDDNFKIEEIQSSQDVLNDVYNDGELTQKQFSKKHYKEQFDKPKKVTSFDRLTTSTDITSKKVKPGKLPELPDL